MYRLCFWKLIGALEQDNWMWNQDLQKLRTTRAKQFLDQAETQRDAAAADQRMFDRMNELMTASKAPCPPLATP
jgi:hypothetical protein